MDKQNVILKTHELEVVGHGPLVTEPCQIGEWWVMPAEQYTGTIPPDIVKKWENFKALNIPVLGYLIADDMREVVVKREKAAEEQRERERREMELRRQELERAQKETERLAQEAERQRRRDAIRLQEAELRQRSEAAERDAEASAEVVKKVLIGTAIAAGTVALGAAALPILAILAFVRFDPILIAVLPDGRWICLGAWWD